MMNNGRIIADFLFLLNRNIILNSFLHSSENGPDNPIRPVEPRTGQISNPVTSNKPPHQKIDIEPAESVN